MASQSSRSGRSRPGVNGDSATVSSTHTGAVAASPSATTMASGASSTRRIQRAGGLNPAGP